VRAILRGRKAFKQGGRRALKHNGTPHTEEAEMISFWQKLARSCVLLKGKEKERSSCFRALVAEECDLYTNGKKVKEFWRREGDRISDQHPRREGNLSASAHKRGDTLKRQERGIMSLIKSKTNSSVRWGRKKGTKVAYL